MASQLESCTIGNHCGDVCHKTTYSRKTDLTRINELSHVDQVLLFQRCGLGNSTITATMTVCLHHQKIYLEKYEFLQKKCCDPFQVHTKSAKTGLRTLDIAHCAKVKRKTGKDIKPGQKLCPRCSSKIAEDSTESDSSSQDPAFSDYGDISDLNTSVTALGCSPIKPTTKISNRDTKGYAKRKLSEAGAAMKKQMGMKFNIDPPSLDINPDVQCTKCEDLDQMVKDLREKCTISTRQKKIQILTMAPPSWSIEKTSRVFDVSMNMVREARKLKTMCGVLAEPPSRKGRQLCEDIKKKVIDFYEDDEYSRLCPGKKDFVSTKIGGERVQKQKRLLLANIQELYAIFKEKNSELKIGISKFFELRPPWCITVGNKGAHSVCVCESHQNAKLLLAAIGKLKLSPTDLLALMVCDIKSKDCMIHRCDQCPGVEVLRTHIHKLINDQLILDDEDKITFSQWVHTDRTTVVTRQESVTDFIDVLCEQLDKLTTHDFTSKSQAAYLSELKETLSPDTVIVLLDFAENYSFIIQDSIQGFYWENKQATLHPFGVYYRNPEGNLCSLSLCVISDSMQHDTVSVYAFMDVVLKHVKETLPGIKHVKYFSDGAASQYKNYKNFCNLCFHFDDFGLSAEWNFFATSHGKSICDGIGGTVKRLATRASLQRTNANLILTPMELYDWAKLQITGITVFFVSATDVDTYRHKLDMRFSNANTIPGTRSHHSFIPLNNCELKISRISGEYTMSTTVKVNPTATEVVQLDLHPGQYVAAIYEGDWWLGNIVEVSHENADILLDFLHPRGPAKSFSWPRHKDQCWIPHNHILCKVDGINTPTGRQYNVDAAPLKKITERFEGFHQAHK